VLSEDSKADRCHCRWPGMHGRPAEPKVGDHWLFDARALTSLLNSISLITTIMACQPDQRTVLLPAPSVSIISFTVRKRSKAQAVVAARCVRP